MCQCVFKQKFLWCRILKIVQLIKSSFLGGLWSGYCRHSHPGFLLLNGPILSQIGLLLRGGSLHSSRRCAPMVAGQRILCSTWLYKDTVAFLFVTPDSITFLVAYICGIRYLHSHHCLYLASSDIPQTILPHQTAFALWICDFNKAEIKCIF